ncbi:MULTISPECIES: SGNH/GDSL hydrolase family protein [Streptomyces]|uniref:SGNH/GDSL hydrolase family protein n=1 Tax=Streptomyces TaxID=1883 RepID=UPI00163C775B|nr:MULTISPECIES: SGNH/GDSL hydrolase family protein [Streptomyces]MBC2876439.1 SGNH/GDSL hydrolase family protein [Streptomyces sp. TYQ1024]UBI40890.1 SGNH/GDSL hydrolase family protein [Streptomyces mobaraensis]
MNPDRETAAHEALTAKLVRFQRPERDLPYLTGLDEDRVAGLFGLTPPAYRDRLAALDAQTRTAAAVLRDAPGTAGLPARLPFAPGQRIVALGESTTADRLSWLEILRHLLPDGVAVTNLAVSGSTTTQALAQAPALTRLRPGWVLCLLGTNDARRTGPATLVSASETRRNLAALRELTDARWVWLTPTPVDEKRVASFEPFRRAGLTWAGKDVDAITAYLLERPEPAVDTRPAVTGRHLDDGVHITLDGQREITAAVLRLLAEL